MKINRIFKNKIHFFDLFFGFILVILLISIYFFFNRKVEFVNIRVKVTDQDVLYANTSPKTWYANRFEVGDTENNELGQVTSQITGVETFNTGNDSKAVYLDIKTKAVYNKHTKLYSAKATNLVFGNTIKFNFAKVAFYGLVTEPPNSENQKTMQIEKKRVVLMQRNTFIGVEPDVLSKIKAGDKIIDSKGNLLFEVINISLQPALRVTQNSQGDLLLRYDPYYKDAVITADVRAKKLNSELFAFDNIPIKLGIIMPLNFTYESISPVIIDIK